MHVSRIARRRPNILFRNQETVENLRLLSKAVSSTCCLKKKKLAVVFFFFSCFTYAF